GLYEFDGQPLYECPLWDRMEHSGWGTRRFDFGKGGVDSFLLSSAYFFFDIYRIDGLRVDAVASMLYLNYDRAEGDFTPNIYGDNRNLEAIEFLKKFNVVIKRDFAGAVTVAEESTAYPKVTAPIEDGGLGFDYKWNMGWMNDVLFYCRQDPYFRNHHHNKITFSMVYAFSEKFILPLSHDEVVHVKGSIVNKMSGEYEAKFAGERALLGFMFAHPGKKLNFMGYEFAQFKEWDYTAGLDFFLADKYELHAKMKDFVRVLNLLYKNNPPLYEIEDGWTGFKWLVVDDRYNNLIAFSRYSESGESVTAVINFSGIELTGYKVPIEKGSYRLVLNTDDKAFGGSGRIRKKVYLTEKQTDGNGGYCLNLDIPRLSCMYLKKD
ncbi:MAG: alpha amylase C-terminal domain-containing protein, partial [Clostridia bacterium]|nr:alpha amylase C-terminal domain-containing protein [Clostridia bacterium]